MKLRVGFVTNSSSTSYVFAYSGEPNLQQFLDACGADVGSPAGRIFEVLFRELIEKAEPLNRASWRRDANKTTTEEYVVELFSPGVLAKIKELEANGYKVLIGQLSSDDDYILSQFCVNHFIVEAEGVYLHALNCVW